MSTTDGDATSRLDEAIADVLHHREGDDAGRPARSVPAPTTDEDWDVDGPDDDSDGDLDQPFELPDIVPATPVERPTGQGTRDQVTTAPSVPPGTPSPEPAVVPPSPAPGAAAPQTSASSTTPATSWSDHMVPTRAAPVGSLRTPGRRPRVRRVTRVVRHIDPWSTFKLALLFSVVAYLVALTAGVLLWRVADSTGTLDNVERWFTQFGWETFELQGGEIFHNAWIIGLFGAVAMTGGLVLLATLFNLVSDIVGGIRVTVLEEEVVERTVSSTRRYVVRRPPVGAESASAWDVDETDADDAASDERDSASNDSAPSSVWSVDDEDDDDVEDSDGSGDAADGEPAAGGSDPVEDRPRRR